MKGALFISLIVVSGFFACQTNNIHESKTVADVDLERYAGTWYEIAKFPNRFEKGLDCITATYTLKDDGSVEVYNKGRNVKTSEFEDIKGNAKIPDPNFPGQLEVTFFAPFSADYHIYELDDDYQYALVGSPNKKFLWILSRTKSLEEDRYNSLIERAKSLEFEVEKMERVNQDC
ncbi:MAG: lipocalin family protein [Flavobacteriales bacterium]|nr:lipocalin family protein [Flavobacteriales bacterium]